MLEHSLLMLLAEAANLYICGVATPSLNNCFVNFNLCSSYKVGLRRM
jgi:hypothetical protein